MAAAKSKRTSTAKKKRAKQSKPIVKTPKISDSTKKLRKQPTSKKLKKTIASGALNTKLPSISAIARKAVRLLLANRGAVSWFVVVYGVLSLVFVSGVAAPLNFATTREQLAGATESASALTTNITLLGNVMQSSFRATGEVSSMYQTLFLLASILAFIWLFRQQQAGQRPTIKEAFYKGMYPIVPFIAIIFLLGVYSVPSVLGGTIYASVAEGGLAVSTIEQFLWLGLYLGSIVLSFYLVATGYVALFVVTLPDVTPTVAVRESKKLVENRRFAVMGRVLALMLIIGLVYVMTILPAIYVSALFAQVLYMILTILVIPFAVAYLFVLYRELL